MNVEYLVGGGDELVSGNVGDFIGDLDIKSSLGIESLLVSLSSSLSILSRRSSQRQCLSHWLLTVPTAVPP